jgi:predicted regulator of Ras-like GTPase activity (Roadblock/LC7/MglB family)
MNSPGFSADLTSFDLLDLVQVIHLDRSDLCLMVRVGQQTLGELRFRQGELLWARFGEITGPEAFLVLAEQQYGSLEQFPWTGSSERNVYQPLSRLIMQAVAYRDQQQRAGEAGARSADGWGRPPAADEPVLPMSPGNGNQEYPDSRSATAAIVAEREKGEMPGWMRHVSPSIEEIAEQPTGAMPLNPVLGLPPEMSPAAPQPLSGSATQTPPPLPAMPTGEQSAQSTGAFARLNGKRGLPGLPREALRSEALPAGSLPEDPPTVPLPSVQGNLMDYLPRRDQLASFPLEEQGTKPLLGPEPTSGPESFPEPGVVMRGATSILTALASAGSPATAVAAATSLPSEGPFVPGSGVPSDQAEGRQEQANLPLTPLTTAAADPQPATAAPGEAKRSSLSLLEQLAYGSAVNAQGAAVPPIAAGRNGTAVIPPVAAPVNDAALAASATVPDAPAPGEAAPEASRRLISRLRDEPSNGKRVLASTPEPAGSSSSGAEGEAVGGALVGSLSPEETAGKLQEVLEGFAMQVGAAFLATAMLRADGTVVAQHMASKRIEQDLSSAAYHLAHVMQSSLRALLMGGWGDLDETLITGSTHTVVLRRLGWAEKSLFHMAVLERSGNHGLCRVLMRNTEPVLLQLLSPR